MTYDPAFVAERDQLLGQAHADLDRHIHAFRGVSAKHGEMMADQSMIAAWGEMHVSEIHSMLIAAVHRLAAE